MYSAALLGVVVAIMPAVAVGWQDKDKEIRKGDTVSVRGCLSGTSLEATDIERKDGASAIAIGRTFRLTGNKKLIKQLRDEHDGKVVNVEGVLKSELRSDGGQTTSVGRVRIGIGTPSSQPGRPDAESQRSLPVLDVKSFEGGTTACGR